MRVGLLGPLEVTASGEPITVPGTRVRTLLAVLALHPGSVVSTSRLIDAIWGDERRTDPKNALQSQVSVLRRRLRRAADRPLIVSRPPGYLLDVEPEAVDTVRFEALVAAGRAALDAGEAERAAQLLREALALWRGPALVEFDDCDFARDAILRLEELRLGALESRVDADLRAGRHAELVGELESLVAAHPLRETLRGQLMTALYRSGRQADALEVFHDARRVLDAELGLDPSPQLQRRYEAVLRQEDQTPPQAPPAPPGAGALAAGNLPAPLSSFVGRDDEVDRVTDVVAEGRLVTLTGPGGVGKTRLAIEAALRLRDRGAVPDGAWFVELARVAEPPLVADEVAETLGLREQTGLVASPGADIERDAAGRVRAAVRHKRALVVLDNCEHLVDAVAGFARDLLARAPDLTLLCTSREALGVMGETVWSVPSLAVPPADVDRDPDQLLRYGSARLFVDRVTDADAGFVLTPPAVAAVAELCRRLDGIPLALELAAARARALGPVELARRLDDRFRVLTGGDRSAQPRQRTLRAVVEWSWELLDPVERTLFRRLSVFPGGATLDDVEAVCADTAELPAADVAEVLARLVDKSLVRRAPDDQPARYGMLETLRAYARERLDESGEAGAVRGRHAAHVADEVAEIAPRLRGAAQLPAMHRLDAMLDDVRASLAWHAETGDLRAGARLAVALGFYWYLRGHRGEAVRWLDEFAATPEPRDRALDAVWRAFLSVEDAGPASVRDMIEDAVVGLCARGSDTDRAFGGLVAANVAMVVGDAAAAEAHLAAGRAAAGRAGDEGFLATADFLEGAARLQVADLDTGRRLLTEALDRFERVGDRWGRVQCLIALVTVAEAVGDVDRAVAHAEQGLALAAELGMRELEGVLHAGRANLAVLQGDPPAAAASVTKARRLAAELGSELVAAYADNAAGLAAGRAGDLVAAQQAHERALEWFRRVGSPGGAAYGLGRLGVVAELTGDLERAHRLHVEGHAQAAASGDPRAVAFALEGLAATLAAQGRATDAAFLLGAAAARRASVGVPVVPADRADVDRAAAAAVATLGRDAFDAAFERGRRGEPATVAEQLD